MPTPGSRSSWKSDREYPEAPASKANKRANAIPNRVMLKLKMRRIATHGIGSVCSGSGLLSRDQLPGLSKCFRQVCSIELGIQFWVVVMLILSR